MGIIKYNEGCIWHYIYLYWNKQHQAPIRPNAMPSLNEYADVKQINKIYIDRFLSSGRNKLSLGKYSESENRREYSLISWS